MDVDDIYFQQDGVTCHTSGETIGFLREKFPGWVISRNGDYNRRNRAPNVRKFNGKFHQKNMFLQT